MKTYSAKPGDIERRWFVVDLEGATVGRAATKVATILRGKHRPEYTPHVDTGDFVVVINADKVVFKGNKMQTKRYWRHSGYPGGIRSFTAEELLARKPEEVFQQAVKGMMPKNRLGRQMLKKLKIYAGPEHPHAAQNPTSLAL